MGNTVSAPTGRRLVLLGAVLVMLGLLTGFVSGGLANPRMGLASHLEGLMNGTLLIALSLAMVGAVALVLKGLLAARD